MRLSRESQELVKLEYIKIAQEISNNHHNAVRQFERSMPRGGARRAAIDHEYLQMARELVQSKVSIYIEAFRRESLIPGERDIAEICVELEEIVRSISHNTHHPPVPSSQENYRGIIPNARVELILVIKRMQLEQRKSDAKISSATQAPSSIYLKNEAEEHGSEKLSANDIDALELKPNIFGIGINLNHIIKRFADWKNRRKNQTSA